MKKITLLLVCLLLTGCLANNNKNIYESLDKYLINTSSVDRFRPNNTTEFFSFYLPSDMQEFDGNSNSSIIRYNDSKIVMNINIPALVNSKDFGIEALNSDGFFKDELLDYEKNGIFVRDDESQSNYAIRIYKQNDDYLLHFQTSELNYYCLCKSYDLVDVVKHLFTISKSIVLDKDVIVANYSNKDVIEYQKKQVNLFEYEIPVSGFLSELVNRSGGVVLNPSENVDTKEEENNEETATNEDNDNDENGEE